MRQTLLLPCLLGLFFCGCGGEGHPAAAPSTARLPPQDFAPVPAQPVPEPAAGVPEEPEEAEPALENSTLENSALDAKAISGTLTRIGDWQLATPLTRDPRHWSMAPLYTGLIDVSLVTGDPRYLAAVLRTGERVGFELGSRRYHADGHGAGHSWIRLFLMDPERDPDMLDSILDQFDQIVENPITEKLSFKTPPPTGLRKTDRWTWSDALFFSPPTLAFLARATGDGRFLQFLDSEYRFAYDKLYDPAEGLFYRDETYIDQHTPNGEKVFWARGNGWVYAGLALVLGVMPEDHPSREFYVSLFRQMSPALLAAQQADGFSYPSLKDPGHAPMGETSATGLFVFGMAWGARTGLLDRATYWPAVERGWDALLTVIGSDGAVTSVQPFGEAPEIFDASSSVQYGTGAVLMAGAEILRALDAAEQIEPAALIARAEELVPETPDLSSVCDRACRY